MKSYLTTLTALLILPFLSVAQSNFKPGYVVTLKGDTVKGSIDYREWEKNPRQVTFKNSAGTTQQYNAQNAGAFGVTGLEYYEKHIVSVSLDPVDLNAMASKADTGFVTDTVFLKILARGKNVSLYSYTDNVKFRFYLLQANDPQQPEELSYHVHYNTDQSNTLQYVTRYRSQLQYAAQRNNVAGLENMIGQAHYSADELTKIVTRINGDSNQQAVSKSQFGIRWFVGAAAMDNTLKTEDNIEAPPSHVILPKIVAGVDFMPNKDVQQLILRAELSFNTGSYSFANPTAYPPYSGHFKQNTISIVPQFLFNFYNTDNLKVFIDGGISFNISSYSDYAIDFTSVTLNNYPPLAKAWVSIPLKLGVTVNKKIEIYAGYIPLTNLTTVSDFPVTLTTYQAGLNYLFGSK